MKAAVSESAASIWRALASAANGDTCAVSKSQLTNRPHAALLYMHHLASYIHASALVSTCPVQTRPSVHRPPEGVQQARDLVVEWTAT